MILEAYFLHNKLYILIDYDCHIQSFSEKNKMADALGKAGFVVEEDREFLWGMLNVVKVRKK